MGELKFADEFAEDSCQVPGIHRISDYTEAEIRNMGRDFDELHFPKNDLSLGDHTLKEWVECPVRHVYAYLADLSKVGEWSWSANRLNQFDADTWVGHDAVTRERVYCKTTVHRSALTVDHHWAWNKPDQRWLTNLFRVLPAGTILGRRGSIVIWTKLRHYNIGKCSDSWAEDLGPISKVGHRLELTNLKRALEYRHYHGMVATPEDDPSRSGERMIALDFL